MLSRPDSVTDLLFAARKRAYLQAGRAHMVQEFYRLGGDEAPYAPEDYTDENLAHTLAWVSLPRLAARFVPPHEAFHVPPHLVEHLVPHTVTTPGTQSVEAVEDSPPLRLLDVQHAITAPRGPNTRSMTRSQSTGRVVPLAA